MKAQKNRKGFMLVIVFIFAISISIGLFSLIQVGSTIATQNKKTLYQLQSYYLAQSAVQHTTLIIKQLPLETFKALKNGATGDFLESVNTKFHPSLGLVDASKEKNAYDIFFPENAPDSESPYAGEYELLGISLEGSQKGMTATQDSYKFKVRSTIYPSIDKKRGAIHETIEDELIVSRFVGGISSQ